MVDCPHCQRLGYGDGQNSLDMQIMNRNAAAIYAKWAIDGLDPQDLATGQFPQYRARSIVAHGGPHRSGRRLFRGFRRLPVWLHLEQLAR